MSQSKLYDSPTVKVVESVNRLGLTRAAQEFNTSASTLSRWLRQQGYELHRVYVLTDHARHALEREVSN